MWLKGNDRDRRAVRPRVTTFENSLVAAMYAIEIADGDNRSRRNLPQTVNSVKNLQGLIPDATGRLGSE
jgi:hypothetical protein